MEIELSDARMFVARLDAPPPWPRIGARLGGDWPPGWSLAGWHKKMAVRLEGFEIFTDVRVPPAVVSLLPHECLVGMEGEAEGLAFGPKAGLRIFVHRVRLARARRRSEFGGLLLPRGITDAECAGAGITIDDTDPHGLVTWMAFRREPRGREGEPAPEVSLARRAGT